MGGQDVLGKFRKEIRKAEYPRELAIDVMYALQARDGYLTDEGLVEGAELLGMTPLEMEELATFYDFIYREPVGEFVIHACDGVVCWMFGEESVVDYLCRKLDVAVGERSRDGLFTVLPSSCIGQCDKAPAMMIRDRTYGPLTPEKIDEILETLKQGHFPLIDEGDRDV
ncbi:MAG: NADH-quinone oxidoreductase subunit NuoE [Desulfatiglandaceae bacterium]